MDTIQILPYLPITLSILTFVCAWAVIPYLLNSYNTDWLPAAAVFQVLPPLQLRLLALPPVIAMILFTGAEFTALYQEYRKDYPEYKLWQCLSYTIPHNYYFALAVVSVILTQAALWSDSLIPLIAWTVMLLVFLRKETLLFVRTFSTLKEARMNALYAGYSDDRMEELIQKQNPEGRDLKVLNVALLYKMYPLAELN